MNANIKLEKQATALLRKAGYRADGRKAGERRLSIRAISTPCGGQPSWRRK